MGNLHYDMYQLTSLSEQADYNAMYSYSICY